MKLNIQSIHFDADSKLIDFIQKKLDKLDTFSDRVIDGEVFLRFHKDIESRDNKVLEVKINLPGATLFTKETNSTFEAAADIALDALKIQIKKYMEKKQDKSNLVPADLVEAASNE